jgi:hypothetical protein
MGSYEVSLEPAEPDGFAVTVPALPGLLILALLRTDSPPSRPRRLLWSRTRSSLGPRRRRRQ